VRITYIEQFATQQQIFAEGNELLDVFIMMHQTGTYEGVHKEHCSWARQLQRGPRLKKHLNVCC